MQTQACPTQFRGRCTSQGLHIQLHSCIQLHGCVPLTGRKASRAGPLAGLAEAALDEAYNNTKEAYHGAY